MAAIIVPSAEGDQRGIASIDPANPREAEAAPRGDRLVGEDRVPVRTDQGARDEGAQAERLAQSLSVAALHFVEADDVGFVHGDLPRDLRYRSVPGSVDVPGEDAHEKSVPATTLSGDS